MNIRSNTDQLASNLPNELNSPSNLTNKCVDQIMEPKTSLNLISTNPCYRRKRSYTSMISNTTTHSVLPNQMSPITDNLDSLDTMNDYSMNEQRPVHYSSNDDEEWDANLSHPSATDDTVLSSLNSLKLNKLDPEFADLVSRFVGLEHVSRCLELAGFCTLHVLFCLDEVHLERLEEFVRHACSLMKSVKLREYFTGPLFAHDPSKFRLPSGSVCGILLAVNELRRRHRFHSAMLSTSDPLLNNKFLDRPMNNVACQTQSYLASPNSSVDSVHDPNEPNLIGKTKIEHSVQNSESLPSSLANVCEPSSLDHDIISQSNVSNSKANSTMNDTNYDSKSTVIELNSSLISNDSSGGIQPTLDSRNFSSSIQNQLISNLCGNGVIDDEAVDLFRLKQHSAASAIRLASRQFVNAHLVRGRDFDVEMEFSLTPDGFKRVTGIFYCHLCREKRERSSAVRFSIARNRYPVLSNVLSHLKTHFFYRGQANQLFKASNGALFNPNSMYQPYPSDTVADSSSVQNNPISFISPSVLPNQFSAHLKSDSASNNFVIIDNDGPDESSTEHGLFDNLSMTSPSNSNLNSPNQHKKISLTESHQTNRLVS